MVKGRRDRSSMLAHLPFAIVMAIVLIAGLRIWMYHWRQGAALIAGALFVAAVLRGILSTEQSGLLAIRSRVVDILSYGGLGVLIFAVAVAIGEGPFT